MKTILFVRGSILAAVFAAAPAHATAAVQTSQYKAKSADGYIYGYDGCSYSSGYAFGGESVAHTSKSGAPVTAGYSYGYLWGYNWCTGESYTGWGSADVAPAIDAQLNGATVDVPMTLQSWSCTYDGYWYTCSNTDIGTGTMHAVFTGTGDTTRSSYMNQWASGPYRTVMRSSGTYRAATVDASLVINGADYLNGATSWGWLSNATSGSFSFYRN